jgi:CheY-like chemotaxis protein
MRVLIVEDEKRLAAGLKKGLEAEGFATDVAHTGSDGLWMAREHGYDAIVLDILLPGMNGFRVCAELREAGVWTPILMLTAKDGDLDQASLRRRARGAATRADPTRSDGAPRDPRGRRSDVRSGGSPDAARSDADPAHGKGDGPA